MGIGISAGAAREMSRIANLNSMGVGIRHAIEDRILVGLMNAEYTVAAKNESLIQTVVTSFTNDGFDVKVDHLKIVVDWSNADKADKDSSAYTSRERSLECKKGIINDICTEITGCIKRAAEAGEHRVIYNILRDSVPFTEEIIKEIFSKGFDYKKSSCRKYEEYDQLVIIW